MTFLLLLFGSATNLLIAIGKENIASIVNKLVVGIIKLYNPIPSVPISLVIIILIIKPRSFEILPPISKITVEEKNLFFKILSTIINCM